MVEHPRIRCHLPYFDITIFQPSKMKFIWDTLTTVHIGQTETQGVQLGFCVSILYFNVEISIKSEVVQTAVQVS